MPDVEHPGLELVMQQPAGVALPAWLPAQVLASAQARAVLRVWLPAQVLASGRAWAALRV